MFCHIYFNIDFELAFLIINVPLFFKEFFSKILFIYLFWEKGEEGRKRGKHQCVVASCVPRTGDLAHNPGMGPDWESNQQPFGSQTGMQSTEPHQPGQFTFHF